MWNSTMEFTENQTRNASKIQNSSNNTGSIEVGVIIMGMSCVCVVACALIILQVRSASRQRQRRRRQRSSAVSIMMDGEDPYQSFAPPTYEAVIRSPHLYPPSPRSSVASVISISSMRRESSVSSLSKLSARISSQVSRDSPSNTASSVTQNQSSSAIRIEDLEDPPPPYPGILASTYIDMNIETSAGFYSSTDGARNHRNSCHSTSEERHEIIRNGISVNGNDVQMQMNTNNNQDDISSNNIPENSRRGRSCSHGNEIQRDIQLPNNSHHRNSVHGIVGNHRDSIGTSISGNQYNNRECASQVDSSSNRKSGRGRSVSVVSTSNFLLPSQAWDTFPRELSFINCQSSTPRYGTSPSHDQ